MKHLDAAVCDNFTASNPFLNFHNIFRMMLFFFFVPLLFLDMLMCFFFGWLLCVIFFFFDEQTLFAYEIRGEFFFLSVHVLGPFHFDDTIYYSELDLFFIWPCTAKSLFFIRTCASDCYLVCAFFHVSPAQLSTAQYST